MIPRIKNQQTQDSPAFCFSTLEFDTTLIVLMQCYASCFNVECSCLIDIKDWLIGLRRNATCTFFKQKNFLGKKINRRFLFIQVNQSKMAPAAATRMPSSPSSSPSSEPRIRTRSRSMTSPSIPSGRQVRLHNWHPKKVLISWRLERNSFAT